MGKNKPPRMGVILWAEQDSNLRPHPSKGCNLIPYCVHVLRFPALQPPPCLPQNRKNRDFRGGVRRFLTPIFGFRKWREPEGVARRWSYIKNSI